MKECKDCIHYDCCGEWTSKETLDNFSPEQPCKVFKNAADVVEVCRCKDCDFAKENGTTEDFNYYDCALYRDMRKGSDFCNYGKRRD
jgi:hypothetical protein